MSDLSVSGAGAVGAIGVQVQHAPDPEPSIPPVLRALLDGISFEVGEIVVLVENNTSPSPLKE